MFRKNIEYNLGNRAEKYEKLIDEKKTIHHRSIFAAQKSAHFQNGGFHS